VLAELAPNWRETKAVVVDSDVRAAIGALGWKKARIERCSLADALFAMAGAARSSGAYGTGPGNVRARERVWELLAALAGLDDQADFDPEVLGAAGKAMSWYRFDPGENHENWLYWHYAAWEDPASGRAWAWHALDTD
jgi:hypothetical protein